MDREEQKRLPRLELRSLSHLYHDFGHRVRRHVPMAGLRLIVYILVAVNLVYLAWHVLPGAPGAKQARNRHDIPYAARTLVTLEERRKREIDFGIYDIQRLVRVESPGAEKLLSCFMLGPFPDKSIADEVGQKLVRLGFDPRPGSTSDTKEHVGYRVYLPAMAYEDAARARRLLDSNNGQTYLIDKDNVIALGTFRTRSEAERQLEKIQVLGLEPKLVPSYVTRTVHWLEVDKSGSRSGLRRVLRRHKTARIREQACR